MNAGEAAHAEAQELLPWLANGSLTGTELERVQSHLQVCAVCRSELAVLHTLRAAGSGSVGEADPEAALARLLPRLDEPPAPMADAAPTVPPGWRARLAANDRSWLRFAVAVQFGAIVVLSLLLAHAPAVPDAFPAGSAGDYRLLGADAGTRGALVVAFRPETPERELRRIVQASGARIVGGPTVTGAWLLDTGEAPAAVVARLRAEPAVTLAEALGAESRP